LLPLLQMLISICSHTCIHTRNQHMWRPASTFLYMLICISAGGAHRRRVHRPHQLRPGPAPRGRPEPADHALLSLRRRRRAPSGGGYFFLTKKT
jgi:hypothetical protein